jgi:excisionase family DNA binding protein
MNMPIDASQHDQTEWISLHEASALLGVNSSTLRRWGDSGRVPMKRTLGGHRRFSRPAIMRLAEQQAGPTTIAPTSTAYLPAAHHGWNFDSRELARQEWHARLATGTSTSRMRGLGQRLLGLLIQYVNRHEDDHRFLIEARAVGESYGRESRAATINLHDTVEAFLFFRSTFSQLAMPLPSIAQPPDLAAAAGLHARLDRFMDAILLGAIAGFEGRVEE